MPGKSRRKAIAKEKGRTRSPQTAKQYATGLHSMPAFSPGAADLGTNGKKEAIPRETGHYLKAELIKISTLTGLMLLILIILALVLHKV